MMHNTVWSGKLAPLLLTGILGTTATQAQVCSEGRSPAGQLGVGLFHCVGGACGIYASTRDGMAHHFTVEPRVRDIDPNGASAGILAEGDVLVAIDDVPVTTPDGGRRLAQFPAGRPVKLSYRHGGRLLHATITAPLGCDAPRLTVTERDVVPTRPPDGPLQLPGSSRGAEAARAPFELGVSVECGACAWRRDESGALYWDTPQLPRISAVEPGSSAHQAGLKVGDVILRLDGRSLLSRRGALHAGTLRGGQRVTIEYLSGDSLRSAEVVLRAPQP